MGNSFCRIAAAAIFMVAIAFALNSTAMDAKERLAIIKALKLKGIVGENNKGLLEFRSDDRKAEAIVDEENGQRTKVYNATASKNGVSSDVVGAQRAAQIAKEEQSGVWLQDAKGKWDKKK